MPELPEVETMCRGIAAVVGSEISEFERIKCRLKPIQIYPRMDVARRRVLGSRVLAVERLGKRVALKLNADFTLIFEPRMTGLVLIADPPNVDHLRVRVGLKGGSISELWFWDRRGLGSVQVLSEQELRNRGGVSKLGPDALAVDAETLQSRLRHGRRAIKVALLDQRAVAGIGNLYAAEILHVAKIHPEKPCGRLNREQWFRIHAAMIQVLTDAIRYEGSTLADGTYRNALNHQGSYQNHHRVYNREGKTCASCTKGKVRRIVQAQRATFFCPNCQRAGATRRS